jgi:hypothetical protein
MLRVIGLDKDVTKQASLDLPFPPPDRGLSSFLSHYTRKFDRSSLRIDSAKSGSDKGLHSFAR